MKNFTNNFKQITSRLSARWLIMALMLLLGTSSAWANGFWDNEAWNIKFYSPDQKKDMWINDNYDSGHKGGSTIYLGTFTSAPYLKGYWAKTWGYGNDTNKYVKITFNNTTTSDKVSKQWNSNGDQMWKSESLNIKFPDSEGSHKESITFTINEAETMTCYIEYEIEQACDIKDDSYIRIEIASNTSYTNVYAWYDSNTELLDGWPGKSMTTDESKIDGTSIKYIDILRNNVSVDKKVNIIFNYNNGNNKTDDITGLQWGKVYKFDKDGGSKVSQCLPPACTPSATITKATYSCYGNTIHLEGSLTEACGGMYYGWQYKTTSGDDWSAATAIPGHATYNYSESATTYELDWTIPNPGTTYYFRAYATPDANTWYSDGTSKTVPTYARATQYNVTGDENTLTLSGSQTGYTYTLYDTNGAVAGSSKTGNGNALTWDLSEVSTFSVKARPTGSSCDEVEMNGNYTNRIDPISDVTLNYCDEYGKDIPNPNPMCKGATAYVKLSYVGSKYSDIKWLVEGVETNLVTDKGDGVWSYEIQGDGSLSVELKNDANTDPAWPYSNKLPFSIIPAPTAPYISINPASGIICEGSEATIKVENPSKACSYKLVEEEDTKAGFKKYESGDLKYSVGSVGKYYVAAKHIECTAYEYTSNQVAINQIISTSAKISIDPAKAETTPWEPVSITVTADEGYVYEVTYPENNLQDVEGVIIKQKGDTYTYYIPRPSGWGEGHAISVRTPVNYGIKAQLKVDGEANQCDLSFDTATITVKDEENEDCD